ncbi:alpha/beta hydrolase fold domain-containing protein [Nocardia sp. CA-107356]|uniref:alpha/beta hydrolase fold domain-containing protein n=1 Tax=Nocardia sp. CA-107356 TaxID=3239972 RepID=UPI003D8C20A0
MNGATGIERPPLGIRLLHALQKEPDWPTMTAEDLVAYRDAANRRAASRLFRVITGSPDRRAAVCWQEVRLSDRVLRVRVYRPSPGRGGSAALPLVLHVHGGGFVGTAAQCDWANSHLAARLPAVVVSVEHRLLAQGTALSDAVEDGWDVLQHMMQHAAEWGIAPERTAVAGESTGALIAALAAIRAKAAGLHVQAQVLINPVADLTETMFDYASMAEHAHSPTLSVTKLRLFQQLAVPPGTDPGAVSPLHAADLSGLAPALVVVPTLDPLADHGRRYAERLREFATPARLIEHPGATHAFLTLPGVVPQAKAARAEITEFLRGRLAGSRSAAARPTKAEAR